MLAVQCFIWRGVHSRLNTQGFIWELHTDLDRANRIFKETIMTRMMLITHNFAMEVSLLPSVLAGGWTASL